MEQLNDLFEDFGEIFSKESERPTPKVSQTIDVEYFLKQVD